MINLTGPKIIAIAGSIALVFSPTMGHAQKVRSQSAGSSVGLKPPPQFYQKSPTQQNQLGSLANPGPRSDEAWREELRRKGAYSKSEEMRLQMQLERQRKLQETLSKTMKKSSETGATIRSNQK
jgi:hypothetical protein